MEYTAAGVEILQNRVITDAVPMKRVAAYCRVSTNLEQQASSLKTQREVFEKIITQHPGWQLVGIYADEGLSGTRASNRVQFQRMIMDCEDGKIDYILTKSISRFARNTMEFLQYVRKLRDLGVNIYFDDRKLDTGNMASELLLTVYASTAQEESHSISENMKWGMRKRFQAGIPKWSKTYGFYKDDDGEYRIEPEQAKGVRRIFELCIQGLSLPKISQRLEEEGIPAMNGGKWWPKGLATVLHNEKYVGDVLMQKTYTVDHLTHKRVENDRTIVPSYYARDHHEPIVDRKTFNRAQTILSLKDKHKGCTQYPYYGTMICPLCGQKMVRFILSGHSRIPAWTCGGENGRSACPPYFIREEVIDRIVRDAYDGLDIDWLAEAAKKNGIKAEAARAALHWKEQHRRLDRIDYILLDDLIEKITFAKWREAVITWKFGTKSHIIVQYDRPWDMPNVEIKRQDGKTLVNGEAIPFGNIVEPRMKRLKKNCEIARELNAHGRPSRARLESDG